MTVDFTHGYQPPGVYIEEDPTPLVSTTGLPPVRVAIVGRALGYQSRTQQVTLSEDQVRLTPQGIDSSSVVVRKVSDNTVLAAGEVAVTATTPGAGGAQDYYTDIALAVDATTEPGTAAWVTYNYVVPDYFAPRTLSNFEDIKGLYGTPLNLSAQALGDSAYQAVVSPLSLAAQFALINGAAEVVLVPIEAEVTDNSATVRTALAAAYAKISTDYAVSIVVPLTDGLDTADAPGAGLDLLSHLVSASNDGFLRTGVLGFDPDVTTAPDALVTTGGFKSKRVMLAYASPAGLQVYNGNSNQSVVVGHQYLAAAYAGRMAALPVQKSLTKEQIAGFAGVAGTPLSNALKNQYAASGVAVTEIDRLNRIVVRHGLTTDRTNINTAEMSVVRARDAMVNLLQNGVESSGLIGQPIDDATPLNVKSVVAGLLEYASTNGVFVSYTGLAVRQASTDPSVIEVKFEYRPAYPLNYILISFSINVTTGDSDLTAEAA